MLLECVGRSVVDKTRGERLRRNTKIGLLLFAQPWSMRARGRGLLRRQATTPLGVRLSAPQTATVTR